jgi:hypothetical protein
MTLFTQLRQDIPDNPIGLKVFERKEGWKPQTPIRMEHVNAFRRDYEDQSEYPYRITFCFDNFSVAWVYQSKSARDLDYTYLWENYVKMS